MTELVLYSRAGCHLCDEMKAGLAALGLVAAEVEVGWQGELADRYGRLLPVLELDGREVCHYFLDVERLQAALAGRRS